MEELERRRDKSCKRGTPFFFWGGGGGTKTVINFLGAFVLTDSLAYSHWNYP